MRGLRWKSSKQFFFEKKNEKTFTHTVSMRVEDWTIRLKQLVNVFCFFFSKKKCFLFCV
jgi:hypothetical protein